MQRGLSAFDLMVVVHDLQNSIGSYIENIYQISRDEILIKITNKNTHEKEIIFIRNEELICITQQKFNVPEKPSVFAMTLRKYLQNGRITNITQHMFDRIIFISIGRADGEYTLVVELIPKGNIILLNSESVILASLIRQQWAHRTIKIHEKYVLPPSQINPFELSYQVFADLLKRSTKDLVRFFAVNLNFGGAYAEELLSRIGMDKTIKPHNLSEVDIQKLFDAMQQFLDIFRQKQFEPYQVRRDSAIVDVIPILFKSYAAENLELCGCFISGLEALISQRKQTKKTIATSLVKREALHRQLRQQQESIQEFQKRMLEKQKEGELIYHYQQALDQILTTAVDVLKQKDKTEGLGLLKKHQMVSDVNFENQTITVLLRDTDNTEYQVILDIYKSVSENAQNAYAERKKLSEKIKGALEAVEQTKAELANLEKHMQQEEREQHRAISTEKKSEKTYWFEQFRWFITSEGNVVVGGKDAKSNELVVKKYLRDGDRYVHADVHGAPSVIVKTKNIHDEHLSISEKSLEEACIYAASFSKAWNQFAEAQAYWVHPEQVSKTPQSGEYVPKGGFIIRGKRNYQRCTLELAVGKINLDGIEKLMCGPERAVQAYTDRYLVVVPGGMKKAIVAKIIARTFAVSVESVEQILPPGNMQISRSVGLTVEEGDYP